MDYRDYIHTIPDYPKPGIMFRDITSLLEHAGAFRAAVDDLVKVFSDQGIQKVAGIEARGFILGGAIAHQLDVGFLPIRKAGKLPRETVGQSYELEYGSDTLELHVDSVMKHDRVLLVDDLIATGGTAEASLQLIRSLGGNVIASCFVIDLPELGGRARLEALDCRVHTLVDFEGE